MDAALTNLLRLSSDVSQVLLWERSTPAERLGALTHTHARTHTFGEGREERLIPRCGRGPAGGRRAPALRKDHLQRPGLGLESKAPTDGGLKVKEELAEAQPGQPLTGLSPKKNKNQTACLYCEIRS